MEDLLEVRRHEVKKVFDKCFDIRRKGKIKHNNLSAAKKRRTKILERRAKEAEIFVCQNDKSGRFCVLSREDYIKAVEKHSDKID